MKKILSCILAAAMLVGMLTVGAFAENGKDLALKFNDIPLADGGGNAGMANLLDTSLINASGFTVTMDFVYGRSCVCNHPTDATMKHTSKFAINVGGSEGTYKYIGYSADMDVFFLATGASDPMYGEGANGLDYLATSETGLVQPGVSYHLAFEFISDTGIVLYVDGTEVLSFDLYEDLDYPTYFAYSQFMMFPTHMTCFVDNFAVYEAGVYNPTTGEGADKYGLISTFDDGKMVTITPTIKDEEGNVVEDPEGTPITTVSIPGWQIVTEAYSVVEAEHDVYAQPNYIPAEGQANIIFQSGLDKKANGEDEIFSSGKDFNIDLTIKNNTGLDSLELDLVNDPYITIKSVEAADGLTATLGTADENGLTKLTITGSNYTGEALANITYTMNTLATQDHYYRYGAKVDTMKITGAVSDAVITGGISKVYNYTVGDLNDDGEFNMADVILILKKSANWKLDGVFVEAGDVNVDPSTGKADGRTNAMDATYYMRWIAGWKGYTIGGMTNY